MFLNLKILIAICCIDERVYELHNCIKSLQGPIKKDIIGIFRNKDTECQKLIDFISVDDYELSTTTRHNLSGITNKRNAALNYARKNNYDRLIFIDSDIKINWLTIPCLLLGSIFAEISCVVYPTRWANMLPVIGFENPLRMETINYGIIPFKTCYMIPMGCTCINIKSPKIPETFTIAEIPGPDGLNVFGEDVGFCLTAKNNNARIVVSKWNIARHMF